MSQSNPKIEATSMICMYALRLSTTTVDDEGVELEFADDDEEGLVDSRVRSSSARWPEKERQERRERGEFSRDQVEKAVMKPVVSKGSSSASEGVRAWGGREGRSEVTRHRGLSCERRRKRWWEKWWRSSTTRPQEVHSVIERPPLVMAHRPCDAEQYGHFISSSPTLCRLSLRPSRGLLLSVYDFGTGVPNSFLTFNLTQLHPCYVT